MQEITGTGEPHSQYRASHNLVLSSAASYPGVGRLQDFDMHGTNYGVCITTRCIGGLYLGGAGGYYVEVDGNTFLGSSDGYDYTLRGYPVANSFYHNNVSLRKEKDAIKFFHCIDPVTCINHYQASDFPISPSPPSSDNQFADNVPPYTDPTIRFGPASLGVGDFDSDGDDNLFLATGAAWYYSPAGQREWRFLSAKTDTIDQLLFGDFDGDGRTDVVTIRAGQIVVSWGGVSDWEFLNPTNPSAPPNCTIADMAVGDFGGNGKSDLFCTANGTWLISFGGNTDFVPSGASSGFPKAALRFGHFGVCGTGAETDVFSVQNTGWYVSCGAMTLWKPLGVSLPSTVDGLLVADFNGDGNADVLAPSSDGWQIRYEGSQSWTDIPQPPFGGPAFPFVAAVGHFTGHAQADDLVWDSTLYNVQVTGLTKDLLFSSAGASLALPYSTQDMR